MTAHFVVLCTNTMHKVADEVAAAIDVPMLHIGDTTATAVKRARAYDGLACSAPASPWPSRSTQPDSPATGWRSSSRPSLTSRPVHRSIYDELCVGPDDSSVPVFATTRLHVQAAVDRALNAG